MYMKKLNHQLETKWIKKYIKETVEIENLKYLMQLIPSLIPSIKIIKDNYYVMEKCEVIEPEDFEPDNFYRLYIDLLIPLYKFKRSTFTPGIYKYFVPYSLNSEIKEQHYVPYIMNELEKVVQDVSVQSPKLLEDKMFANLIRYLKSISGHFENWKPHTGYSLLHGDLHIGNIVKKNNKFLLIDYEYLRYGASELEISNLIISSLIWHYKKGSRDEVFFKIILDYLQSCNIIFSSSEYDLFLYFMVFSLSLFYLNFYIKKDKVGLKAVIEIFQQLNDKS